MNPFKIYYPFKQLIPRSIQIQARRGLAYTTRGLYKNRWPIDRGVAARPDGFLGWPGGKQFALVLRHDVETARGMEKCPALLDLERAHDMKSCFYFVPEDYELDQALRARIVRSGGEVGVHGLRHDGTLYRSWSTFRAQAAKINCYLRSWGSVGFASPSSHHRFDWLHELDILYDTSSFDTDPFEPQPDGIRAIYPVEMSDPARRKSYIELPYTLPQDFTIFVILQATDTAVWQRKLDWVARRGGMAMVTTHPDYMRFPGSPHCRFGYPARFYEEFLSYVERTHRNAYWMALPREVATFWRGLDGTCPGRVGTAPGDAL